MRIEGIDLARALAVFGMIIVNFKLVIGATGDNAFLHGFAELFTGKASATFVVLAGIGIAMMTNKSRRQNDENTFGKRRKLLLKRAAFLFVVGLLYSPIWPADILHFYGIYMAICAFLLKKSDKTLWFWAVTFVLGFLVLVALFDYEKGWNWADFSYSDFWEPEGFIRNLFYNGFHPVIPWTAFMIVGILIGRKDLTDKKIRKSLFLNSLYVFTVTQIIIWFWQSITAADDQFLISNSPMPPLPVYMVAGSSFAITLIMLCIYLAEKIRGSLILKMLVDTGQLALTLYVAHVIIGMGAIILYDESKLTQYSIEFTMTYVLIFCVVSVVFSTLWKHFFKRGPLEILMRKVTG